MSINFLPATYEIKISDIYTSEIDIPQGYVAIVFHPPKRGELFLNINGKIDLAGYDYSIPRLICKETVKPLFESTGRLTKEGCYLMACDYDCWIQWGNTMRKISTLSEEILPNGKLLFICVNEKELE